MTVKAASDTARPLAGLRVVSMAEQYYLNLDPALRARVEALEVFDEWEDWHVMSAHYCLSWAFSPIKR